MVISSAPAAIVQINLTKGINGLNLILNTSMLSEKNYRQRLCMWRVPPYQVPTKLALFVLPFKLRKNLARKFMHTKHAELE